MRETESGWIWVEGVEVNKMDMELLREKKGVMVGEKGKQNARES